MRSLLPPNGEPEMMNSPAHALKKPSSTARSLGGLGLRVAAAGRERTLARAAIAAIAVHLIDDNFVQPEAGTSAADHLVSGLVPLAALFAFAALCPRLRAGLRAAIAIPLGLLGIVAGVGEAGYYSLQVGPSGDDYTGLLTIPAGLLLVGIGATTLWTARRRDDRLYRRYPRRLLLTAAAVVGGYVVLFP